MKVKNIFLGIILAVMGILMITIPETCINVIVILVGAATLVNGIYSLKKYYNLSDEPVYKKTLLAKCISSIIIGILAVFFPLALMNTFTAIWTVITFVLAVYLLLFAFTGFFSSLFIPGLSDDDKKRITYESFIYFIIAVLLFITPIGSIIKTLFIICGIVALVLGVVVIAKEVILQKRTVKAEVKDITESEK